MEGINLLEKLERVKAPIDFEQRVLELLSIRKETKRLWRRNLRLSFAGALAFLLVVLVTVNVFVLQKREALDFTSSETLSTGDYIPIIETVDYSREIQSVSYEPGTIYILEQVSENHLDKIKY
ncbi:MAG: hypothetical protein ACETWK_00295 [Candidatus Aminicenantaceae bacterium]